MCEAWPAILAAYQGVQCAHSLVIAAMHNEEGTSVLSMFPDILISYPSSQSENWRDPPSLQLLQTLMIHNNIFVLHAGSKQEIQQDFHEHSLVLYDKKGLFYVWMLPAGCRTSSLSSWRWHRGHPECHVEG